MIPAMLLGDNALRPDGINFLFPVSKGYEKLGSDGRRKFFFYIEKKI